LDQSDYHPWVRNLFNFLKGMTLAGTTRIYPWVGSVVEKFLIPRSIMEKQKQHVDFANERINRRLNLESSRPDLMTPFLQNNPDFMYVSREEIESNFTILIVAGSETTATVLCGILSYITKSPDKLATLSDAIRNQFKTEHDISISSTKDVAYLDMVIEEGLRLCLPVPGALPRVVPEGGGTYAGHYLPQGVSVGFLI
jgi:cytochrome P450